MKVQTEIPEVEKTFNDDLSKAIHELHGYDTMAKLAKDQLGTAKRKVVIEMKKSGKDFQKIQLNGEIWEAEVKRTEEKLSFKRSKV